ncbi:MAG: RND transporter [Gammaproteobacteria bacterium]|nr:MAG: RND transporter [Gammaproteobacteria bacterium]
MPYRALLKQSIALSFITLSACTTFSAKQDYAALPQHDLQQVEGWQTLADSTQVSYLTDLFNSPAVDDLLQRAFADNPSLQQTLITLDIYQAQLKQTSAQQRPQINAGLNVNNKENSDTSYSSSLSISWQADVWGKLKDSTSAAQLDISEQQYLFQAAKNSLAANIMQSWLSLISQQRDIDIQQQRVETLSKNEAFIIQRYRNGLGSLEDLDSARSSFASAQATLIAKQESYQQQLRSLKTLVGQLSSLEITIPEDFPTVKLSMAGIAKQDLAKRPDLIAAYSAIEAASLRSKVAYKDLLPSFSLEAMLEDIASSPRDALFVSPVWSLLAQLTAPLYQGGELRAAAEIAELQTASDYQQYREILLNAVTEVENAIGQEKSLSQQHIYIQSALASTENNLQQYQQNYRTGLVDILDLLSIQQQSYDLAAQLNSITLELLSNRISLGLALGLEIKQ